MYYAKPLARLVGELEKLPGIGPKSAQRLAFHLLRQPSEEARMLAGAIMQVKEEIHPCSICYNFTDQEICQICSDPRRDRSLLCVVADPRDLIAIERTNEFRGLYHVLGGVISPMDRVFADQLRIKLLEERVRQGAVREVILALPPSLGGEATTHYLHRILPSLRVAVRSFDWGPPPVE